MYNGLSNIAPESQGSKHAAKKWKKNYIVSNLLSMTVTKLVCASCFISNKQNANLLNIYLPNINGKKWLQELR